MVFLNYVSLTKILCITNLYRSTKYIFVSTYVGLLGYFCKRSLACCAIDLLMFLPLNPWGQWTCLHSPQQLVEHLCSLVVHKPSCEGFALKRKQIRTLLLDPWGQWTCLHSPQQLVEYLCSLVVHKLSCEGFDLKRKQIRTLLLDPWGQWTCLYSPQQLVEYLCSLVVHKPSCEGFASYDSINQLHVFHSPSCTQVYAWQSFCLQVNVSNYSFFMYMKLNTWFYFLII